MSGVIGWVSEWLDEWVSDWMSKWLIGWVEWLDEWVSDWMSEWVIGWVSDWLDEWSDWMSGAIGWVKPLGQMGWGFSADKSSSLLRRSVRRYIDFSLLLIRFRLRLSFTFFDIIILFPSTSYLSSSYTLVRVTNNSTNWNKILKLYLLPLIWNY